MTALLFLDTETTGLHPDRDEIWEIAAVLVDGRTEAEFHVYVEHSADLCRELPESFRLDHAARYPIDCMTGVVKDPNQPLLNLRSRAGAADDLVDFIGGTRPLLVGAVPSFDQQRLGRLIRATQGPHAREPWHYHLQDVETLIVGYLRGAGHEIPAAPYDSNALSRAVGVDPDRFERHTAMGDVRWAMALWDAVMTPSF